MVKFSLETKDEQKLNPSNPDLSRSVPMSFFRLTGISR